MFFFPKKFELFCFHPPTCPILRAELLMQTKQLTDWGLVCLTFGNLSDEKQEFSQNRQSEQLGLLQPCVNFCHSGDGVVNCSVLQTASKIL